MHRPISAVATCCERRVITRRPWPTSIKPSSSIPKARLGAQAFHARGLIHQRQGEQALAITDFDNAIDRDPFAAAPYQARAQSLTAQGKYAQAIEDDNAALNVDSKNAEAWADLGVAYEKSGNNSKARESYSRAKVIDPNNRVASDGLSRIS